MKRRLAFCVVLFLLAAADVKAAYQYSTVQYPALGSVSSISFSSQFYGHQSGINRDYTGSAPAYDYSVHIIRDGTRYRMYSGGRWSSTLGDGDHVLQHTSITGAGSTWTMPRYRPEFWQGGEEGFPGFWYSGNYLEPEVVYLNGTYYMYTQVQIDPGAPIDIEGQVAATQADRIQLHISSDGDNWTRWSTTRGVVINITNPTVTNLDHEEVVYVPWDTTGRPWWLYTFHFVNGVPKGHVRIRSADPTTYDWNAREPMGFALGQLGNQIGYCRQAPGGPIFCRISFASDSTGRMVPSLEFSRDGLVWTMGSDGPVLLAGSTDNSRNRNCYFLGMSTLYGQGMIQYLGNNTYRAIYGATTCNSPGGDDIWYSEVGVGEVRFTITPSSTPAWPPWEFSSSTQGWTASHSISGLRVSGGRLLGTVSGDDPILLGPYYPDINADANKHVLISMRTTTGTTAELFWTTPADPFHRAGRSAQFPIISDNNFHTYVIDLTANPEWKGIVNGLRLDPTEAASGSFAVDYIRVVDLTPPTGSVVINEGAAYTTSQAVTLTLSATDGAGVSQMSISNDGVFDTEPWEPYAESKTWNLLGGNGLRTVYVRYRDPSGNESGTASDTIVVGTPCSMTDARSAATGTLVILPGQLVTASFGDCIYIEDAKGRAGVRVSPGVVDADPGEVMDAAGTATVVNGEKTISLLTYKVTGTGSLDPLAMINRALGGGDWQYDELTGAGQRGVSDAVGLNNIGLLVRVWGQVTEVEPVDPPAKPLWFKISDGSGRVIKCVVEAGNPVIDPLWQGKHAVVTGISSCELDGERLISRIRISRDQNPLIY